ncbi:programmed cell death protein 6-like [Dermacentor albipictus]|uniref:programmed cell death protein 6-like n=1 Tax=Dermacentor albipictus TaxID=60249 RepID=UPI0031FC99E3
MDPFRRASTSYGSRGSPRAQPRGVDDVNYLRQVFCKVDKDRSGRIDANELQQCLCNGTWKPFNPGTVRMMINIFDRSRSGTVSFDDFVHLWKYINDWLRCFRDFDKDGSGCIDRYELRDALTSFGYRLSGEAVDLLVQKYDREKKGSINFDDYILCCVTLQTFTNAFKSYDTDLDGYITISYENFLKLGLSVFVLS